MDSLVSSVLQGKHLKSLMRCRLTLLARIANALLYILQYPCQIPPSAKIFKYGYKSSFFVSGSLPELLKQEGYDFIYSNALRYTATTDHPCLGE